MQFVDRIIDDLTEVQDPHLLVLVIRACSSRLRLLQDLLRIGQAGCRSAEAGGGRLELRATLRSDAEDVAR